MNGEVSTECLQCSIWMAASPSKRVMLRFFLRTEYAFDKAWSISTIEHRPFVMHYREFSAYPRMG